MSTQMTKMHAFIISHDRKIGKILKSLSQRIEKKIELITFAHVFICYGIVSRSGKGTYFTHDTYFAYIYEKHPFPHLFVVYKN